MPMATASGWNGDEPAQFLKLRVQIVICRIVDEEEKLQIAAGEREPVRNGGIHNGDIGRFQGSRGGGFIYDRRT